VEKYGRARRVTADNIVWRMRFACWMSKATDTQLEYVIFIALPVANGYINPPHCYVYTYIACHVTSRKYTQLNSPHTNSLVE
jgi:hypothetical protein